MSPCVTFEPCVLWELVLACGIKAHGVSGEPQTRLRFLKQNEPSTRFQSGCLLAEAHQSAPKCAEVFRERRRDRRSNQTTMLCHVVAYKNHVEHEHSADGR